ncbi:hypothetical protein D3C72_1592300 [compost metagenome]
MLCRGALAQAVQTIRLVAPAPMPVSRNAWLPLTRTSAIFGSPTAIRVIATGDCTSCCRPSPTSSTAGSGPSAAQLPVAASAAVTGMPLSKVAQIKPLNNGIIRLCIKAVPCTIQGVFCVSLPRMTSTPERRGAPALLAITGLGGAVMASWLNWIRSRLALARLVAESRSPAQ